MPPHDHDDTQARPNHRHAQNRSLDFSSLPTALTAAHITDSLHKSPDDGATLDLTHLHLTDVGEVGAEELASIGREGGADEESSVVRIALSYNRLATLPTTFALLSRLRYLNLRSNSFSVFPHVLTVMPSLEILDIRRNKIKRFPSHPGSLVNLKVLSMSRNKITRLPPYFAEFRNLENLALDHNPIEWPPRTILEPFVDASDEEATKEWIQMLQAWIEQHATTAEGRKYSDDSAASESQDWEFSGLNSYGVESPYFGHESDFDVVTTPHARSFSAGSDGSLYSDRPAPSPAPPRSSVRRAASPRPPPLQLGFLPTPEGYSASTSPSRSPDSYLPTPEGSTGSGEEPSQPLYAETHSQQQVHGRNASYAPGSRPATRPGLATKKSLPDLRTAKFSFGAPIKRQERGVRQRAQTNTPNMPNALPQLRLRFAVPRQDSASSDDLLAGSRSARTPYGMPYVTTSPTTREAPAAPVDVERNSYFRRLSTISSSTVHKAIPLALLAVVEGVRDIMFAVTQIYQTLEHYAECAGTGTLSSVLKKVLDPASTYITRVINALDRFDSVSRRALPPPTVCRAVVEGCKHMVAGFGKAVELLFAQLKVIALNEDKRYTRQMLLVLYGSTAEIARAWALVAPHIEAVRPLLHERPLRAAPHAKSRDAAAVSAGSTSNEQPASTLTSVSPFLPPRRGTASPITPILRSRAGYAVERGSARRARRQAGSFSVKDVELGREMASAALESPPPPALLSPPPSQTPTPKAVYAVAATGARAPMGPPPLPLQLHLGFTGVSPMAASAVGLPWANAHSRQGSQASLLPSSSSASSSPLMPTSSSTLADKEAIAAVEQAVEAAPPVWEMVEELAGDLEGSAEELREGLMRARAVTARLKERLADVKDGEFVRNRQALREDAQVFIKIVVQLSNVMKSYTGTRVAPSTVRAKMVALTNATEACLMLLHVSSFSTPTPRPHSPLVVVGSPGTPVEDGRLGASLGRSRSAAASQPTSARSPGGVTVWRDAPRSALPHQQAFKIGAPLRNAAMGVPRIGNGAGNLHS